MKKLIILLIVSISLHAGESCQESYERIVESRSLIQLKSIEAKRSEDKQMMIQVLIISAQLANNMNNSYIPLFKKNCRSNYKKHKESVDEIAKYFKNIDVSTK